MKPHSTHKIEDDETFTGSDDLALSMTNPLEFVVSKRRKVC